jgi:hypothetical protein
MGAMNHLEIVSQLGQGFPVTLASRVISLLDEGKHLFGLATLAAADWPVMVVVALLEMDVFHVSWTEPVSSQPFHPLDDTDPRMDDGLPRPSSDADTLP